METDRIRLRIYLIVFAVLLSLGIIGFMSAENLSLVDAVYFSIVTMATVGYGDIHPQSLAGKILALLLIVGGVGTFLGVVASVTDVLVKRREEALRRQKLNMVTGLFFSEMGNGLLRQFARLDPEIEALYGILNISDEWTHEEFQKAERRLGGHSFNIDTRRGDLLELRGDLQSQANRDVKMRLSDAIPAV
jgi:voltage-gated potassium channel